LTLIEGFGMMTEDKMIDVVVARAGSDSNGNFLSLETLIMFSAKNPGYRVEGRNLIKRMKVSEEVHREISDQSKWQVSMECLFNDVE
jgi:hypothetical protein